MTVPNHTPEERVHKYIYMHVHALTRNRWFIGVGWKIWITDAFVNRYTEAL